MNLSEHITKSANVSGFPKSSLSAQADGKERGTSNAMELLPCPFCGSHKLEAEAGSIECRECGAMGPDNVAISCLGWPDDRRANWNKRVPSGIEGQPAQTKALWEKVRWELDNAMKIFRPDNYPFTANRIYALCKEIDDLSPKDTGKRKESGGQS